MEEDYDIWMRFTVNILVAIICIGFVYAVCHSISIEKEKQDICNTPIRIMSYQQIVKAEEICGTKTRSKY